MRFFRFAFLFLAAASFLSAKEIIIDPNSKAEIELGAAQTYLIPSLPPKFTIRFLKNHFQVRILSPLAPGRKPVCAGTRNDEERIFSQDVAEFFICTDKKNEVYYHIGINPEGLCYTARKRDTSWNPAVKTRIEKIKNAWIAHLEIPYKDVDASRPVAGTVWRANFAAKVPMGNGARNSANWSGARDFHQTADFGTIRFGKGQIPRLLSWHTANDMLNAVLCVPGKYASAKVICEINDKKYPGKRSGQHYSWRVPLFDSYVYPKLFTRVKISLIDRNGKEIFSRSAQAEPLYSNTFTLNGFYCPPEMKEITYSLTFPLPGCLRLKDGNGKVIRTVGAAPSGKLSLEGLSQGRYIVEMETASYRTSRVIYVVPSDFRAPRIGENDSFEIKNGLFYLAGKPVFLIGGSNSRRTYFQWEKIFNMRVGLNGHMKNAVNFQGVTPYRYSRVPYPHYLLTPGYDKAIDANLRIKRRGNRFVHRLAYEAQFQLTTGTKDALKKIDNKTFYADLYKRLKKQYPGKYISIQTDAPPQVDNLIGSCDVFEFASYASSYAINMMYHIQEDMTRIRKKAGSRPVVFWLGGSIPNPHCRTAEELRAAVYCAIILNINGAIIHLGHEPLSQSRVRLWSLISGITAEISRFYGDFASGVKNDDFVTELKGSFLYTVRKTRDKVYLLAVNLDGREQLFSVKTRAGNASRMLTPYEPILLSWPIK